jgi:hypothetical protein
LPATVSWIRFAHLGIGEGSLAQVQGGTISRRVGGGRHEQLGAVFLDDGLEGGGQELPDAGGRAQLAIGQGRADVVVPGMGALHLPRGQGLAKRGLGAFGHLQQDEELPGGNIPGPVVATRQAGGQGPIGRQGDLGNTPVAGIEGGVQGRAGRRGREQGQGSGQGGGAKASGLMKKCSAKLNHFRNLKYSKAVGDDPIPDAGLVPVATGA